MLLHSNSFRAMTQQAMGAAQRHCKNRLVIVHEGGYSEAYVPFCGQAIIEALSGITTPVVDPALELLINQQPDERVVRFQRQWIDDLAAQLNP